MIEIKGGMYAWGDAALKEGITRLLDGQELIINHRRKTAYIGPDCFPVAYDYAVLVMQLKVVGCDTGNLETGERHYDIYHR